MSDTPRTDEAWKAVSRTPDGMYDSRVPTMAYATGMFRFARQLEREMEQERQDRKQADLDTIRALGERNEARALAGELIAAIRINVLRGTFADATIEHVDEWIETFTKRLKP